MNYQQAIDYLYSFLDSEKKLPRSPLEFNLPRMVALLHDFGEPQHAFPSVVVAGTKGKGSTSVFIESITRASGARVGLWTSPHLHSYRERIQIDRVPISQEQFVQQIEAMQPILAAFDTATHGSPTVFEVGFALALGYFAAQQVELAVLEVGLGGRYDGVNVVTPLVSVITSISYDHMAVLGDTLAKIAYEKAGIIKPGVPVITIPQHPEAMAVIERVAQEVRAPLFIADEAGITSHETRVTSHEFEGGIQALWPNLAPGLKGTFQRENAALATGAALLLRTVSWNIPDAAITQGITNAQWPGRFELIDGAPPILLDGAHNGDSARRLIESIRELLPDRRIILVIGTMKDKDIDRILAELVPHAAVLVLTKSRHPRALNNLDQLAERARPLLHDPNVPVIFTPDIPEAIDAARQHAAPEDLIVATGSLAVVAAAREALGLAEPD